MKRRAFIENTLMAVSAAAISPAFSLMEKRAVGLQLYTLRDVIKTDVKGIMKQVSDFGYKKIETYGYSNGMLFDMKASEFSDLVKGLGMQITSGHYGTGQSNPAAKGTLVNGWEQAVADAKAAGQHFMIIAYLDKSERGTLDDYKKVCDLINKQAEVCKSYGVRLGYHNHAFEFDKIDNQVPYDLMLQRLDPKLVSMEMDLYWTIFAGQDPLKYFAKYPGRFQQWHIKDMDKTDRKKNCTVGTGSIDFKAIFAKAAQSGMVNFYLEHDTFSLSPIEHVKEGFVNLAKIAGVG